MLEQVLDYIHNYFVRDVYKGRYVISNGNLVLGVLQVGQYFRIRGSVFNDGIYKYPAHELNDETFVGEVWAMAVPPAVIALCADIEQWAAKYGEAMNSPYNSESFGGYSYTKKTSSGQSANDASDWRSVFKSRLDNWRKIS